MAELDGNGTIKQNIGHLRRTNHHAGFVKIGSAEVNLAIRHNGVLSDNKVRGKVTVCEASTESK